MAVQLPDWRRRRRDLTLFSLLGAAILASYVGAFALKFGFSPGAWEPWFGLGLVPVLVLKLGMSAWLGLHREMWRYAGLRDLVSTTQVILASSLLMMIAVAALPAPPGLGMVVIHDFLLSLLLIGGVRLAPRAILQAGSRKGSARPALIIGAGDAGEALVRELAHSASRSFRPVAIVDDDVSKHGKRIGGVPVLGTLDEIGEVARRMGAEALLLAIYAIPGERLRQIRAQAIQTKLPLKKIPAMAELLSGRIRIHHLQDFSLEELLGREPIRTGHMPGRDRLARRCILVTGAAGSIGSELCRQVLAAEPAQLILLDHSESALFHIEQELLRRHTDTEILPALCSIRDVEKMRGLFEKFDPDIVFHAAAYKHVPMLEHFPEEAVLNNVQGTRNVALLARDFGCERFVLISTDKAVRPTSVMGTTKRIAELIVAEIARGSETEFSTIRFGNVLGSNGSVIETFRRQIAEGGPVTVTHPEMRRFFMSIPEAVELVLFAATMESAGGTMILDMGEQVRILDLARHLIRLYGLEPHREIAIRFSGLRPGEKLREELWTEADRPMPTDHPRILRAPVLGMVHEDLEDRISMLVASATPDNRASIIAQLRALVPAYTGQPACVEDPAPGARPAGEQERAARA